MDYEQLDYWRESYDIDERGIVQSPGAFESEHWYTLVYWQYSLDGGCGDIHATMDDNSFYAELIVLEQTDHEKFPEFLEQKIQAVNLIQTESGFIYLEWLTLSDYQQLRHEINNPVNPVTGESLVQCDLCGFYLDHDCECE